MGTLRMNLPNSEYDISIGRGLLCRASELLKLERKVFIVSDNGVPREYGECIARQAKEAKLVVLPQGEATKSLESFGRLMHEMLDFGMSRKDAVVAVGGGVVGDLAGFAASAYMRGVDFYNIPTTLLSQVDSSIGGKTAVNLGVTKNIVGAFYQPKAVIIDVDTLKTLDKRELSAGLAEAVKMSLTSNAELFSYFESCDALDYEKIITEALKIKKAVVEEDEREAGIRKILNFGHSFGHGIEALMLGKLYHGECVALGMIPMTAKKERARLIRVLEKFGLPTSLDFDTDAALSYVVHDKKSSGGAIEAVFVDEVGSYRIEKMKITDFQSYIKANI